MSPCSPVSSGEAAHCIKAAADILEPAGLRSGDGPLSVRGCPSTVKGTRRSFLTAPQK
jgi:hypothetical protein